MFKVDHKKYELVENKDGFLLKGVKTPAEWAE